jgi:hypothetical protein
LLHDNTVSHHALIHSQPARSSSLINGRPPPEGSLCAVYQV